jgi:hypothetical protein
MSTETTTRVAELAPVHERLGFSLTKFGAWLVALIVTMLGGLLCATPVGVFVGLPLVVVGVLACLSFTVSMSATAMPDHVALPMIALCLAVFVIGRVFAPIDLIEASFRANHTLDKMLRPSGAFGIPLMLLGLQLFLLLVPWVRDARHIGLTRSVASLTLILAGGVILLLGAVLTDRISRPGEQPWWAWLVVPVMFGLAVGLRRGWGVPAANTNSSEDTPDVDPEVVLRRFGSRYAWAFVALATGLALPMIRMGLIWRGI